MDAPKTFQPSSSSSSQGSVDSSLHFLDYWRVIRIRKTVILAVFLLVVVTTTAVTLVLPESYMSMVRLKVDKPVSDITPLGFPVQNAGSFDPYFVQTEFETLKSKSVLHRVITNLNLTVRFGRYQSGVPMKLPEAYQLLSKMVDVRQTRSTSLIEIRVYSDDKTDAAKEAAEIANEIARVYRDTRLEVRSAMARKGIETLTNEFAIQQRKVSEVQSNLDVKKRELLIPDFMAEGPNVQTLEPETVRRLESERITAMVEYARSAELMTLLKEKRAKGLAELSDAIMTALPGDQDLSRLLQDLRITQTELARDGESLGPEHMKMRSLRAMEASLTKQVEAKVEGMMSGFEMRVASLNRAVKRAEEELEAAKRKDAEMTEQYRPYFTLKRDLESVQRVRDAILMRVLQEQVDAALPKSSIVEITDVAEPGLRPVRPNIPLNIVLGVIVGLVVGVGLAFFIEYLDTSVKTIDDVERTLQAPVLGVIPQNVGSLMEEGPDSPHAEAYRVLRTNILFALKKPELNTFTVVSGGAGEGKSTTIFNLCSVFVQNGHRVLLVDSDLRRPSLHKLFKVTNALGLTNYLLGQNKLEEVVQTTKMAGLDFLPSGKLPSSSLGILNSPQMREFIKEVRQRYDYVFFDSPPIMGVSDASVLASMVDVTLLVIQYRKYPQAMTVRAKQMVEKIGGNLAGVVLNNINISQDSYYYYYSGYYYDYYSKSEDSKSEESKKSPKQEGDKKSDRSKSETVDIKPKY